MHFLITGHTGFKGSWLTLLLHERGHEVSGLSLDPEENSLFLKAGLGKKIQRDFRCDIRDHLKLESYFKSTNADIVIHMAAQALVRESYKDPLLTYETNAIGTLNVLKASQTLPNLKAQLVITTDKVYKNGDKSTGYIESDPLGGHDPYSASKAMADIATQSWLASFENAPTAIARAGNVIGGGDICSDRLIPDLVNFYSSGSVPKLRSPDSVRPWQHVLDCLNGYLKLIDALLLGTGSGVWNFGPNENTSRTVADLANIASEVWESSESWESDLGDQPYEAHRLLLNSTKARTQLGWSDLLSFEESVIWTMNWYKNVYGGANAYREMLSNIQEFEKRVK